MVELCRVDIFVEVSMMSFQLVLPHQGHLEQLVHMFAYLKKYHNSEMIFDPSVSTIDMSKFERQDWSATVYGFKLKEGLPTNISDERGVGFYMIDYVDSDHANITVTKRSRIGVLIFLSFSVLRKSVNTYVKLTINSKIQKKQKEYQTYALST